jgi:hypothetical protein
MVSIFRIKESVCSSETSATIYQYSEMNGAVITLLLFRIYLVPFSAETSDIVDRNFAWLSSVPQGKLRYILIKAYPFPSISFPIHHSFIILYYDAKWVFPFNSI